MLPYLLQPTTKLENYNLRHSAFKLDKFSLKPNFHPDRQIET